jgi:hypothetical protein
VIRNSWGKGCSAYDRDYDCKDGNIYIPKETFIKQVGSIDRVEVK